MLETQLPIQTFRGTLAEVLAHQDEISPDSILEVRVFSPSIREDQPTLADSLAELIEEAQHIQRGEPIEYQSPRKQVVVNAIKEKFGKQAFGQ